MNDKQTQQLEKQALELIKSGKTSQEIERELDHEFIFMREQFNNKVVGATLWK